MKVLLLSAYDAASHRYWYQGLISNFAEYEWTVLSLPARYFSWRIRGNSLTWAFEKRDELQQHYDLLIATSMVDLSSLRGFLPQLANIPTIVYFHENQFAYPLSSEVQKRAVEPQIVNMYTALCADKILFNSAYNRDSFLSGVAELLKKLPDCVPGGLLEQLKQSSVLPVPVQQSLFERELPLRTPGDNLSLVWNHRWEYDKGPDRLLALVKLLVTEKITFSLSVVGEHFRSVPPAMSQLKNFMESQCPERLGCWGYIEDKEDYFQLLTQADVVVSTALHDFQGLAILEGVALGCVPLVPSRLSYPEMFGESCCYPSFPDNAEREAAEMLGAIKVLVEQKGRGELPLIDVSLFSWSSLSDAYRQIIESTVV